jgi:hypothetical protein
MPTLEFKGKQFVYSHHLSVPFRELQVVPEKSLPVEGQTASLDDNLIIHGDNLEALKALLPTHAGKIDCIFIKLLERTEEVGHTQDAKKELLQIINFETSDDVFITPKPIALINRRAEDHRNRSGAGWQLHLLHSGRSYRD